MSILDCSVTISDLDIESIAASMPSAPNSMNLPMSAPDRPKVCIRNSPRSITGSSARYSVARFFKPSRDTSMPLRVAASMDFSSFSCLMNTSSVAWINRLISSTSMPTTRAWSVTDCTYCSVSATDSFSSFTSDPAAMPASPMAVVLARLNPVSCLKAFPMLFKPETASLSPPPRLTVLIMIFRIESDNWSPFSLQISSVTLLF